MTEGTIVEHGSMGRVAYARIAPNEDLIPWHREVVFGRILREWVTHYNSERPHSALGPGMPDPPARAAHVLKSASRHRMAAGVLVLAKSVLGGLHQRVLDCNDAGDCIVDVGQDSGLRRTKRARRAPSRTTAPNRTAFLRSTTKAIRQPPGKLCWRMRCGLFDEISLRRHDRSGPSAAAPTLGQ